MPHSFRDNADSRLALWELERGKYPRQPVKCPPVSLQNRQPHNNRPNSNPLGLSLPSKPQVWVAIRGTSRARSVVILDHLLTLATVQALLLVRKRPSTHQVMFITSGRLHGVKDATEMHNAEQEPREMRERERGSCIHPESAPSACRFSNCFQTSERKGSIKDERICTTRSIKLVYDERFTST